MGEHWVPWEPLPSAANRYMVANVAHVEQMALTIPGCPLSLVVVSSLVEGTPGKIPVLAWRIHFQFVRAFRDSDISRWRGPMPHSDDLNGRLQVATWEVVDSSWIKSSLSSNYPKHLRPRHFVVASSYTLYDVAAAAWSTQTLGNWTTVRRSLEETWRNREHTEEDSSPTDC